VPAFTLRYHVTNQTHSQNAGALRAQGELANARRLHEQALAIRETCFGPDHPTTATSLDNLANVLHDKGDLNAALAHHQRALTIRETRLGPNHPDTVRSRKQLAALMSALEHSE
jgi:tetratricopeptide (TPR) repeat protein